MDEQEFERRLRAFNLLDAPGHLLRRNHQRSFEIFSAIVGEDVTRQQIALLIATAKNPGASQRELVELTGIDKSTMKEMAGRLIAKGWISRKRDRNDSRAWSMRITPSGHRLLAERLPLVEETQRRILAPLSEDQRTEFVQCLRILVDIIPGGSVKGAVSDE